MQLHKVYTESLTWLLSQRAANKEQWNTSSVMKWGTDARWYSLACCGWWLWRTAWVEMQYFYTRRSLSEVQLFFSLLVQTPYGHMAATHAGMIKTKFKLWIGTKVIRVSLNVPWLLIVEIFQKQLIYSDFSTQSSLAFPERWQKKEKISGEQPFSGASSVK